MITPYNDDDVSVRMRDNDNGVIPAKIRHIRIGRAVRISEIDSTPHLTTIGLQTVNKGEGGPSKNLPISGRPGERQSLPLKGRLSNEYRVDGIAY
jgi:hypothetical protein